MYFMCISYCLFLVFSMFSTCFTWKFSIYSAASCTVTFRVSKKNMRLNRTADHFPEGKVALIFLFAAEAHAQLACTWMHFADIPLVWKNMSRRGGNQSKISYDKIARNKSGFIFKILKKKPRGGQNGNLNHIICGPWFSAFGRCDWTLKISCQNWYKMGLYIYQLQVGGP